LCSRLYKVVLAIMDYWLYSNHHCEVCETYTPPAVVKTVYLDWMKPASSGKYYKCCTNLYDKLAEETDLFYLFRIVFIASKH